MYKPVDPETNFLALEKAMLAFRGKNNAFRKPVENRVET
jgi:hypothetical protein